MKKSIGAKTLVYPTPVWVVGTNDREGKPNVMTAAWGGICCSQPPCVTVSLRKATYSYGNIVARQAFTISVPSEAHVREVDYFGLVTGRSTDKFAATRLTPVASDLVDAPYVAEFPLILECRVIHTLEIGLHTMFIGEILDVKAEEHVLGDKGFPDIEKARPIILRPRDSHLSRHWEVFGPGLRHRPGFDVAALVGPVGDEDVEPVGGEPPGDRPADAARAPGDQRDPAHHQIPFPCKATFGASNSRAVAVLGGNCAALVFSRP